MAMHVLTDRAISAKKKAGTYGDGGGLYLKVTPTGTKSLDLSGIWAEGKTSVALGLGSIHDITLAEAQGESARPAPVAARRYRPGHGEARQGSSLGKVEQAKQATAMTFRQCAEALCCRAPQRLALAETRPRFRLDARPLRLPGALAICRCN
jgi:hypothetical protein